MNPPKSIFTGRPSASDSVNPDNRRLSTPEYHESFNLGAEASKPPTPLDQYPPARPSQSQEPSWTPNTPLSPHSTRRPSVSATASQSEPRRRREAPKTPPAVVGQKRSGTYDDSPARPLEPSSEPLHKRRRVSRSRHTLDHFSLAKSAQLKDAGQPPSPLFFSHSRHSRPHLPARFSSSEAAARMLSKTRGEDSGIKTVTLARGTYSGLSPPGPTSAASGRSSERSSLPRTASPEGRDRSDPLRLLGSVGVVELLEQDNRPTFVVDIGDSINVTASSSNLQILFANSALRLSSSTWELVVGKLSDPTGEEPTAHASNQFRGWLLSTVIQGDYLDLNPPPVEHGGIVWSCYTLRKRLRVVSGTLPSPAASSIPSTSASNEFGVPSSSSHRTSGTLPDASSTAPAVEPQDYFGSSMSIPAIIESSHQDPSPEPTIPQNETSRVLLDANEGSIQPLQKPDKLEMPPLEGHPSFTNECVLRAHAAGEIDSFHRRDPSPARDHDVGFFDWTRLSLSPSLPRHIQFARSVDWASTALGPIEHWSNDLRAMCNLIM